MDALKFIGFRQSGGGTNSGFSHKMPVVSSDNVNKVHNTLTANCQTNQTHKSTIGINHYEAECVVGGGQQQTTAAVQQQLNFPIDLIMHSEGEDAAPPGMKVIAVESS